MTPSDPSERSTRLHGLDAARGLAMMLVCLGHFADAYLHALGRDDISDRLSLLTFAATPSFVMVSGIVLGFLFCVGTAAARDRLGRKLVDRAFFLLVVAHPILALACIPRFGRFGALDVVFITDVVAVCVITGTLLVPIVGLRSRVALALALYAGAAWAAYGWLPEPGSHAQMLKHLLVGHAPGLEQSFFAYNYPLLQWLGVYLCASCAGELVALARAREPGAGGWRLLAGTGTALALGGLALRGLRPAVSRLVSSDDGRDTLASLTSLAQKLPPGPVYLLVYGGLGLTLVAACLWLSDRPAGRLVEEPLAIVGRNSLFTFVFQYLVYYVAVFELHGSYSALWPAWFAITIGLIIAAAWAWQRQLGSRFLTVGFPQLSSWATGRLRG